MILLTRAVTVLNTVANIGTSGSGNSNWSPQDDVTTQEVSNKIGSQPDIDMYMVPIPRSSEKSIALGSNRSVSSLSHMVPQRFYAKVTYDEHTEY